MPVARGWPRSPNGEMIFNEDPNSSFEGFGDALQPPRSNSLQPSEGALQDLEPPQTPVNQATPVDPTTPTTEGTTSSFDSPVPNARGYVSQLRPAGLGTQVRGKRRRAVSADSYMPSSPSEVSSPIEPSRPRKLSRRAAPVESSTPTGLIITMNSSAPVESSGLTGLSITMNSSAPSESAISTTPTELTDSSSRNGPPSLTSLNDLNDPFNEFAELQFKVLGHLRESWSLRLRNEAINRMWTAFVSVDENGPEA